MTRRFAAPLVLAALVLAVPSVGLADVPPADGGGGTGGGTSDAGTPNLTCTISQQSISGSTCQQCIISGTDTACQDELGNDYNYVCTYSSTVEVWCNGPDRNTMLESDCAVRAPGSGASLAGLAGLAGLALTAFALRRRPRR